MAIWSVALLHCDDDSHGSVNQSALQPLPGSTETPSFRAHQVRPGASTGRSIALLCSRVPARALCAGHCRLQEGSQEAGGEQQLSVQAQEGRAGHSERDGSDHTQTEPQAGEASRLAAGAAPRPAGARLVCQLVWVAAAVCDTANTDTPSAPINLPSIL